MAKKVKYYVVWKGRKTGIFSNWDDCNAQITGFAGAEYKSFESRELAEQAYRNKYDDYKGKQIFVPNQQRLLEVGQPVLDNYSVDASCIGNPGILEYRGVHTQTHELLFKQGPFENGTNNIGEFLAIVHALSLLKQKNLTVPIYSDSANAIHWVRDKQCKTNLRPDSKNKPLFDLIARAEAWLNENRYPNKILKWETEAWGEIAADYGRK